MPRHNVTHLPWSSFDLRRLIMINLIYALRTRYTFVFLMFLLPVSMVVANDFPTLDRVMFVLECMQENDAKRDITGYTREDLYQCTCQLDVIAKNLSFVEYDEARTFQLYASMPGEKGGIIRDNQRAKGLSKKLDAEKEYATRQCPTIVKLTPNSRK